ncbi:MAG: tail fiber protein [Bacteroidota bacterium]
MGNEPYLGGIGLAGFNFAPRGWALCEGQILPINQNQSLYSLLGTTYGGDGRTSFALPDLRGRVPISPDGNAIKSGSKGGAEMVTLTTAEIPSHNHTFNATNAQTQVKVAANNSFEAVIPDGDGANNFAKIYLSSNQTTNLGSDTISNSGGGQGHNNMQPWIAITYCISLRGLFPPRN